LTTTLERLRQILVDDYRIQPQLLDPQATLESLGIDSLAAAELMFRVEDVFHITVPPDPVPLPTLGDVAAYIDTLLAAHDAGAGAAPAGRTPPDAASR
jgi:acyl carrier protein